MNKAYAKMITMLGLSGLLLAGCASGKENTPVQTTAIQAAESGTTEAAVTEAVPALTDIYSEIEEAVELPKMVVLNDNYIANYFGIDLDTLEEYVFTNAEEVIYADTVILMKAKADTDKEGLKEALSSMVEHKKAELENYLPEQFKIVEKSEIQIKGNYVYLVISDKAADIETVIAQYIK